MKLFLHELRVLFLVCQLFLAICHFVAQKKELFSVVLNQPVNYDIKITFLTLQI